MDIRAVFIDGKRFSKHGVIIALGVGSSGQKFILGIYQAATENSRSCLNLLTDLESRGLPEAGTDASPTLLIIRHISRSVGGRAPEASAQALWI